MNTDPSPLDTTNEQSPRLKRFLPLGIMVVLLIGFFAFDGPDYVSLDFLRENQTALTTLVANHFLVAFLGFILIYTILVAISFPGASLLSIFAGFMFGVASGTFAVVTGATIGATIIFLIARSAFGDGLVVKAGPFAQKFEHGLKENELAYLFILRLVPIFPFFIVNIVPALFNVKLRNYVMSTFFGIIPGSLVYVSVGNGLGAALSAGENVPLQGLMFQPAVILPILGLIALSLIPIIYKQIKGTKVGAK